MPSAYRDPLVPERRADDGAVRLDELPRRSMTPARCAIVERFLARPDGVVRE